jgi:hypothetical protein
MVFDTIPSITDPTLNLSAADDDDLSATFRLTLARTRSRQSSTKESVRGLFCHTLKAACTCGAR